MAYATVSAQTGQPIVEHTFRESSVRRGGFSAIGMRRVDWSRSTRVRSANSAASAMRLGNARQSCSIYAVSSPNPVRMVRSTSPVRRGSPHRCSAKPPMKQNSQPRSRQNDWMSFARRKRSRIPDSGKHRLLLHQPGGGAHRTRERRFERTVECLDVVGHVDVAEFGASQRRQPGAGDTPPFDEPAQFAVNRSMVLRSFCSNVAASIARGRYSSSK